MESEWLLRSTIPLRIHNTLLQKPGSQALQVCRSHFPSSGSKSLPTDDANSQLLQKEFYRSFKICRQKITSPPPPRILGFLCRFPSFNQSPFFPYLSLNHTLSLLFRGRRKTHPGKKKRRSPQIRKTADPYLAILSWVVCTPVIALPRSLLHCTPYWCYNKRHSWERRTALDRKAHARQERSLLRCASLISQAPIHDQ